MQILECILISVTIICEKKYNINAFIFWCCSPSCHRYHFWRNGNQILIQMLYIPSHFIARLFPWLRISLWFALQKRHHWAQKLLENHFCNNWILGFGWGNFWKRKLRWGAPVQDLPLCNRWAKTTRVWPLWSAAAVSAVLWPRTFRRSDRQSRNTHPEKVYSPKEINTE